MSQCFLLSYVLFYTPWCFSVWKASLILEFLDRYVFEKHSPWFIFLSFWNSFDKLPAVFHTLLGIFLYCFSPICVLLSFFPFPFYWDMILLPIIVDLILNNLFHWSWLAHLFPRSQRLNFKGQMSRINNSHGTNSSTLIRKQREPVQISMVRWEKQLKQTCSETNNYP